jgi:CubicO group peptidase (beta-lactamase class C family)
MRLKITSLLFALSLILSIQPLTAQLVDPALAGMSAERLDRYTNYLQQEIDDGKAPGFVSMVYRNGHLAHYEALGYSNVDDQKAMIADNIFFIQSMTKAVVSTAFMMLYEEGHFQLNDPVYWYLPEFQDSRIAIDPAKGKRGDTEPVKGPIRIIHLLTHTSGLSHGLGPSKLDQDYRQAMYMQPVTIAERVQAMASLPLVGHPGEQWYYSASPGVLSRLVEHFSGMTTAEFLQERLFNLLGMEDTGYNVEEAKHDRVVTLYSLNKEGRIVTDRRQTPLKGNTVFGGSNGLFSTAGDYLKFCRLFLEKGKAPNGTQLLSPKTIHLMGQNHVRDLYQPSGYGFGLGFAVITNLADIGALGSVGQLSWSGAFQTFFFIDPAENLAAVLMTQINPYKNFYGRKMPQFVYQAIVD